MKSKEPMPSFSSPSSRWWSEDTIAVVTGGNKGIGFALVKRLTELGLTVILTARDNGRGVEAVEALAAQGLGVKFFRLDVSDPDSIQSFVSWFKNRFQALDVLVNNAGVSFNLMDENSVEHAEMVNNAGVSFNELDENSVENAETVMKTNFYGPKLLTEALLPLFRRSTSTSRILNISSRLGLFNKLRDPKMKETLEEDEERLISESQIEEMVGLFLEDAKRGTWKSRGWPETWTDYAVSKLALNAYSKVLARRYDGCGLSVNCFCPGFTRTSMTRGKGTHTAEDAAAIGARLALLPPEELPTGKFYIARSTLVCSKL